MNIFRKLPHFPWLTVETCFPEVRQRKQIHLRERLGDCPRYSNQVCWKKPRALGEVSSRRWNAWMPTI